MDPTLNLHAHVSGCELHEDSFHFGDGVMRRRTHTPRMTPHTMTFNFILVH